MIASGFIKPCAPSRVSVPPTGPLWVHEIKHDGYRLLVRRDDGRIRCFTRNGHDWADRFPSIVGAALGINAHSFLLDGEVVILREDGSSNFNALRSKQRGEETVLFAFDLIELNGEDMREVLLIERKRRLAKLIGKTQRHAIRYNGHLKHDGPTVFTQACRMGLEGIVSKRIDSRYASGPTQAWLKSKNPTSEAAQRETEEDWNL